MRTVSFPLILLVMAMLSGCAASYVKYNVNGMQGCAPQVHADTVMGVHVRVNESGDCAPKQQETKK